MLFDLSYKRICHDADRGQKTHFNFLNDSASEKNHNIRLLLNKCYESYSINNKKEILGRITENDDEKFHSVCFELLIAHLFKTIGCSLIEHPMIEENNKHPDFLVTLKTGESFYLELVTIAEYDDWSIEEFRRFIAEFANDSCYFNIKRIKGRDLKHDEYKKLRNDINFWWRENCKTIGSSTTWKNEDGSFETDLEILGTDQLGLGSVIAPVNFHTQLLKKLKKKANKYGRFDRPYIIATTFRPSSFSAALSFMGDLLVQTLYGGGMVFNAETKSFEKPKSLWGINDGHATHKNISGVFFFDELNAYRALEPFKYCLFLNDCAHHPLLDCFKEVFNFYSLTETSESVGKPVKLDYIFKSSIGIIN